MLNLTLRISYSSLFLIFFLACSSSRNAVLSGSSNKTFILKDRSGEFLYKRDIKIKNGEIATRVTVMSPTNTSQVAEKTVTVSKIGKNSKSKILRPEISQHSIWYEKEKYFSQLKTNIQKRSLSVLMESPEEKWQGAKQIRYPQGRIFCFFSQIPECVKFYGMLNNDPSSGFSIVVIWDNYPYQVEAYNNIGESPFQSAAFRFESEYKGTFRYKLEMSNQIIFYEFDVNREFDKMYWIAQGITLVRR